MSFELHLLCQCWSYWIDVLLYSGSIKRNIASPYCLYFKCGKFRMYQTNFDNSFLFIFLSKDKALYKQNFLECTFQKKDLKTLHREFYYDSWKFCIIHFKETRGSSIRLKAFSTSESFKSFWSYCKMSWLLWSTQTMFSDRLFI